MAESASNYADHDYADRDYADRDYADRDYADRSGSPKPSTIDFSVDRSTSVSRTTLLPLFESYLQSGGNPITARAKRSDVSHYITFLTSMCGYSSPHKLILKDVTAESIRQFLEERRAYGESEATIARRLATLKHFASTLCDRLPDFENPAKHVRTPKRAEAAKIEKANEKVQQLLQEAKQAAQQSESFMQVRNYALFCLILDTGLRPEEVQLLRASQIDEDCEWISSVRTKAHLFRNLPVHAEVRAVVLKYREARRRVLERFFPNLTDERNAALPFFISTYRADPEEPTSFQMGAKSIWRAVKSASPSAPPLSPTQLRHLFGATLMQSCNNARKVAEVLGHVDPRAALRY